MQQLLPQNADQSLIEKIQKVHQKHNEQEIARVFLKALKSQGPVHLNIPMEEPLYGMTETLLSIEETPEYNFPTQVLATDFDFCQKGLASGLKEMGYYWSNAPR